MIVRLRNPSRTVEIDGGRSVTKLLNEFGLNRESVLVVRNGTLVAGDGTLDDSDEVELRPVISGEHDMKCRVCREPAVIDVRRHNANFCAEHFVEQCERQVAKAISSFDMMSPDEAVLVAVSGGKDSLALWDLLLRLGYQAEGLYLGLGIGEYSDQSGDHARRFASQRGLVLHQVDLREDYGYDVPKAAAVTRRVPCSACGLSKRHLFDRVARDRNVDVVATGHNLDDEAAVLFGNVLRWQTEYLARQLPVLPAGNGFPRKVKPLVRLTERDMAAYCILTGIDYQVEECPMAAGNKHLGYKEALNSIEERSPGTKHDFYFGYLERASAAFRAGVQVDVSNLMACTRCGAPTPGDVCAFCRLVERAAAKPDAGEATPVALREPNRT